jgi:hypothetical protein
MNRFPGRCTRRPGLARSGAVIVIALAILAVGGALYAQQLTGNIFGYVADEQGGRLPGVTVTLTGAGAPQVFTTDSRGEYRFLNIPPGGNYTLTYDLQGFTKVTKSGVQVSIGKDTQTSSTMKLSSVEATVTVHGESALLETRKVQTGAVVSQVELKSIPTARDPWVVMQSVPGIQVDRVNVGGSESGQQSVYVGKGSQTTQGVWNVDGVTITDMSALGSSPAYYDFDSFEEVQVGTGGTDLSAATPGVQLNLVTKRGTNDYHGSARMLIEKDRWQANNTPAELQDQVAVGGGVAAGNKINEVQDYGIEAGGPLWRDHAWLWASYGRNQINLLAAGSVPDNTTLEGVNGKFNVQFLESTAGTLFYSRDDKLKFGRSAGPTRPAETTWNQSGPTTIWKGELSQVFSPQVFATASYSFVDGGFQLIPQGGLGVDAYRDAASVYHNSYAFFQTSRPQHQAGANASYFFNTGSLGHELKFGFQYRTTPVSSSSGYPGPTASEGFFDITPVAGNPNINIASLGRTATFSNDQEFYNGFIGDTITAGNLTINAGVRYDYQKANTGAATVLANPVAPDILPGFSVPAGGTAIQWRDWEPRVGATYAVDQQKKLVLKGSYARYADQLGIATISTINAIPGYSYLQYQWTDLNHDNKVQRNEINFAAGVYNFLNIDPTCPTCTSVFNSVDPHLKAPTTDEFIGGADYELTQDLVVGAAYTYRKYKDGLTSPGIGISASDFTLGSVTTNDYTDFHGTKFPVSVPVYSLTGAAVPSGFNVTNNLGYDQIYNGVELTMNKRLSNKWSARASFTYTDWKQHVDNLDACNGNLLSPGTPDNQRNNAYGASCADGDIVAPRSTGSGNKGNVFINSKWQFNVSGLYQLPLGFDVGANVFGRQGYPFVRWNQVNPGDGLGTRLIVDGKLDTVRLADVYNVDLRLDKNIVVNPLTITVSAEVFNLTNQGTVLQRQGRENTVTYNQILETQAPRVLRLGARFSF